MLNSSLVDQQPMRTDPCKCETVQMSPSTRLYRALNVYFFHYRQKQSVMLITHYWRHSTDWCVMFCSAVNYNILHNTPLNQHHTSFKAQGKSCFCRWADVFAETRRGLIVSCRIYSNCARLDSICRGMDGTQEEVVQRKGRCRSLTSGVRLEVKMDLG